MLAAKLHYLVPFSILSIGPIHQHGLRENALAQLEERERERERKRERRKMPARWEFEKLKIENLLD